MHHGGSLARCVLVVWSLLPHLRQAGRHVAHLVCEGSAVAACENVWAVLVLGDHAPLVEDPDWAICCEFVPIFSGGEAEDHRGVGLSIKVFLVAEPTWWAGMAEFVIPNNIFHEFTMYFSTVSYIA